MLAVKECNVRIVGENIDVNLKLWHDGHPTPDRVSVMRHKGLTYVQCEKVILHFGCGSTHYLDLGNYIVECLSMEVEENE